MTNPKGRARHLARRSRVREGIPSTVEIPKFCTPTEVREIAQLRERYPNLEWATIVEGVIEEYSERIK